MTTKHKLTWRGKPRYLLFAGESQKVLEPFLQRPAKTHADPVNLLFLVNEKAGLGDRQTGDRRRHLLCMQGVRGDRRGGFPPRFRGVGCDLLPVLIAQGVAARPSALGGIANRLARLVTSAASSKSSTNLGSNRCFGRTRLRRPLRYWRSSHRDCMWA